MICFKRCKYCGKYMVPMMYTTCGIIWKCPKCDRINYPWEYEYANTDVSLSWDTLSDEDGRYGDDYE